MTEPAIPTNEQVQAEQEAARGVLKDAAARLRRASDDYLSADARRYAAEAAVRSAVATLALDVDDFDARRTVADPPFVDIDEVCRDPDVRNRLWHLRSLLTSALDAEPPRGEEAQALAHALAGAMLEAASSGNPPAA